MNVNTIKKIYSILKLLNKKYTILIALCMILYLLTNYLILLKSNTNYKILTQQFNLNNYTDLKEENYNFSLNPSHKICSNQNVTLLIMVAISIDKYSNRALIRATWGK